MSAVSDNTVSVSEAVVYTYAVSMISHKQSESQQKRNFANSVNIPTYYFPVCFPSKTFKGGLRHKF